LLVPDGLQLGFLPEYVPELRRAERLWSLIDEAVARQVAPTFDDLLEMLSARCRVARAWTQDIAYRM
jgi:hypothetical protein